MIESVHIALLPLGFSQSLLSRAKFLHCVRTVCILRTQRLGHSPKNTRHLSSSTAKQQSPPVVHVTQFKCPTRSTIVCSYVLCWER